MELHLEKDLQHQQKAVDAVCDVFENVDFSLLRREQFYENPQINIQSEIIQNNIEIIQSNNTIPVEHRNPVEVQNYLPLDIKMETGTGKTYVYTKTIFELNKRFGINKFIIIVPSIAIKAGTEQFIEDDFTKRHFKDVCGYNTEIELEVLEKSSGSSKQRYFPYAVSDFIKGSFQNTNKIYVLLLNMQLLSGSTKQLKDEYDYEVEGFYRPFDAIKATKPFVIIDEPHRFKKEQTTFNAIKTEIVPQCIIRYGATFPEKTTGKGKNKIVSKDYQNLLYDLNACEAFNQGLIKGVAKEHLVSDSGNEEKVKILSVENKESVRIQVIKRDETKTIVKESLVLKKGDSLGRINKAFTGITISEITKNDVSFSNGETKTVGSEMDTNVYMTSYQEQMLRLALQRHFETERINFSRIPKIKTLALFFIDDIFSYRKSEDGKIQYLLEQFERLLKEEIHYTIDRLNDNEEDYRSFLLDSLSDISSCHAGYFSQDNSDSKEAIGKEVEVILHGKKQLLSFKKSDGTNNTLRFLFSKWTLKEGWDNPNVFTIAKLRSSGSEISKLQEVGRGLRLPVDENGNRIQNEEFTLNYIVDFTEADFAQKLVEEINGELPQVQNISEEMLSKIAKKLNVSTDSLFYELFAKHYIDRRNNIIPENRSQFYAEYPLFEKGVSSGKIKDRNKEINKEIKINKTVYSELRDLWEKINEKYYLFFDSNINETLKRGVLDILQHKNVFSESIVKSERVFVENDSSKMTTKVATGVQYSIQHKIPYGVFLSRIMRVTDIPLTVLHSSFVEYTKLNGKIDEKYFNERTANNFCAEFHDWKLQNLMGHFKYEKGDSHTKGTALSNKDGSPKETIAQGRIGTKIIEGEPSQKYLFNCFAYDSPLEKENELSDIKEVSVYGKIPRCSIAIPTIAGSSYSPDFMYVVKSDAGKQELNVIVETKDVENQTDLRGTEKIKIDCAKIFFENLSREGYKVHFITQLNNKQMKQVIDEVLKE